jgi:hypothetical protein
MLNESLRMRYSAQAVVVGGCCSELQVGDRPMLGLHEMSMTVTRTKHPRLHVSGEGFCRTEMAPFSANHVAKLLLTNAKAILLQERKIR